MATTVTPQIVNVNALVQASATAPALQQSGCLVSVGGTTLTTNNYQFCADEAAVTALLGAAGNHAELADMASSFFGQGTTQGVYVLEIGAQGGTVATQISALNTWIQSNPNTFYAYCVPSTTWDADGATVQSGLLANYASPTGKSYFCIQSTSGTVTAYTSKSAITFVPSPTAAATEYGAAAIMYQLIVNNPQISSPFAPLNLRFVYGQTPWALANNLTSIETVLTAFGNLFITGAEGGISNTILTKGTTMDGNQIGFWYGVDWLQIQAKQQLAAALINATNSNAPIAYNQFGINALLGVLQQICTSAVSLGLMLSATAKAVPFTTFTSQNPTDYANGIYSGFSITCTPQVGFEQVTVDLSAVTFA